MSDAVNLGVLEDGIPDELIQIPQWVAWRFGERGKGRAKPPKVPMCAATGMAASTTDPPTWSGFAAACRAVQEFGCDGIGFVFTDDDPYVGVDLDDCVIDGVVADWAVAIVRELGSYAEYSVSGSGVHVVARAEGLSLPGRKQRGVECYCGARFFAFTGRPLPGLEEIRERRGTVEAFYRRWFGRPESRPGGLRTGGQPAGWATLSDTEVIARCRSLTPKFPALFDRGELDLYEEDWSRADLALLACFVRAGATGEDQFDRLFRRSALVREKWRQRPDYRERSIRRALETVEPAPFSLPVSQGLAAGSENRPEIQERNGLTLNRTAAIRRNRKLGNARVVAEVLYVKFLSCETRDTPGPYPISILEIADAAGMNRGTASRHLGTLESLGLIERESRTTHGGVDPATGEIRPPRTQTLLAPVGGADGFAAAAATADGCRNWGGPRPSRGKILPDGAGEPVEGDQCRGVIEPAATPGTPTTPPTVYSYSGGASCDTGDVRTPAERPDASAASGRRPGHPGDGVDGRVRAAGPDPLPVPAAAIGVSRASPVQPGITTASVCKARRSGAGDLAVSALDGRPTSLAGRAIARPDRWTAS